MMKRTLIAAAVAALFTAVAARGAAAQTTPSVTLAASSPEVTFGESVALSGEIAPAAAGESVEIHDETETVLATATTDAGGAFTVTLEPERSADLRAVWDAVESDLVRIDVRAVVTVRLRDVLLFDAASVSGRISPARPAERVKVTLTHAGEPVATRHPVIADNGTYETTFPIEEPGVYRARAAFSGADLLRANALDGPESPPVPTLREGARGVAVELLERRLVELHYRLARVDRRFDFRTADAVLAFRKVQGMQRLSSVDDGTWRALADPRIPRPRFDMKRFHFEVDQTHQVLFTVERGEITNILHISTGKPSTPTHDGRFHVYRKYAGLTGGGLYYPSYFDGLRALHGYVEVPTYPASHGCVRIPYWNAKWVYGLASVGTPVMVYH
jgi:lipoprotein-anchoring transpeptidase ErfK/SrfK